MTDRVWSPSSLIAEVNSLLEQGFSGIDVEGEITNASASARGHLYFTLKDENANLDCVMWASRAGRLKFEAEDGLAVRARGSLTIYRQRGRFQLVVNALEPQGIGALQLAFEQLKKKLDAEGLFAEDRKRPVPVLPNRVGIVADVNLDNGFFADMAGIILTAAGLGFLRIYPSVFSGFALALGCGGEPDVPPVSEAFSPVLPVIPR